MIVPEGRELDFGEAGCLHIQLLLWQPFACPGLLGAPSPQPALEKHHSAVPDFGHAGRRKEVRQDGQVQLMPTTHMPLMWLLMPRAHRRLWKEETGPKLLVMQQSIPEH